MSDFADCPASRPEPAGIRGFLHYSAWLTADEQRAILADLHAVAEAAPLFSPMTPHGRPMTVRMTSAGRFGWISDRRGYRYSETHPQGGHWPPIPESLLRVWRAVAPGARAPDCCLVNYYGPEARMGMHQDRDEQDFTQPVVSISLGDDGLFRIGNRTRGGTTQSLWLRSGDVMVMGGPARLFHHGVDRIAPGTSLLLPKGGRINLTLRVVT